MLFNLSFPIHAATTFSIGASRPNSMRKAWIVQANIIVVLVWDKPWYEDKTVAIKAVYAEYLKEASVLFLNIVFILSCTFHFFIIFNLDIDIDTSKLFEASLGK